MVYAPTQRIYSRHALTLRTFCRNTSTMDEVRSASTVPRRGAARARRGSTRPLPALPCLAAPLIRDLRPLHKLALLPLLAVWQGPTWRAWAGGRAAGAGRETVARRDKRRWVGGSMTPALGIQTQAYRFFDAAFLLETDTLAFLVRFDRAYGRFRAAVANGAPPTACCSAAGQRQPSTVRWFVQTTPRRCPTMPTTPSSTRRRRACAATTCSTPQRCARPVATA